MLAEGFLRVLPYREERKFASKSKRLETNPVCSDVSNSAHIQVHETKRGLDLEQPDFSQPQSLRATSQSPAGLSIPGCSPMNIGDCSLLEQYPDLQVVDSGCILHNPSRASLSQFNFLPSIYENLPNPELPAPLEPQVDPLLPMPDQGYMVMGHSENVGVDLPGSGLEPMSNSVLNGLLEKQLEEVYMQHLTDNLARCNSHLGNSLLHGLVLPPDPGGQSQGPESMAASQEDSSAASSTKISYLNTHHAVACSSNFSSPVLRISEAANPNLQ